MKAITRAEEFGNRLGIPGVARFCRSAGVLFAAVLFLQFSATSAMAENPMQQHIPAGTIQGNWGGAASSFATLYVPQVNGQITQLGARFDGVGTRTVTLYQGTTLLGTAVISTTANNWSYTNITPVNVTAGVTYKTVYQAHTPSGGNAQYYWMDTPVAPVTYGNVQVLGASNNFDQPNTVPDDIVDMNSRSFGFSDITFVAGGGGGSPPAAPTALGATSAGTNSINLAWSDNSTDETGFRIERKIGAGAYATVTTTTANVTSFADTGLSHSTTYTYRVFAINTNGDSTASNESSASTAIITAASFPHTETFAGGLPTGSWEYFSSNATLGRIEVLNGRLEMDVTVNSNNNLNEAILHINLAGQSNVSVSVDNEDLNDEETFMPVGSYTGTVNADGLSVSDDGITWYTVATWPGGVLGTVNTEVYDIDAVVNANAGLSYNSDFRIKFQQYDNFAKTTDGRGLDNIQVSTIAPPAAPSGLVATTSGSSSIGLTWSDNSTNETGFSIERKTGAGAFAEVATTAANVTSFADGGLSASVAYTYRVIAMNATVASTPSNESSATTDAIAPLAMPYTEDFTAGLPASGWEFISSNATLGRIESLNGRMEMDVTVDGNNNLNEAVLHLNLTGFSAVSLSVDIEDMNDEETAMPVGSFTGTANADGLAVSDDGVTWYTVASWPGGVLGTITNQVYDIDATVNANAGLDYGPDFRIKFQQYDNFSKTTDGRGFDNITITGSGGVVGPANFVYGMWNWDPTILGDNTRIAELVQYCLDLGITDLGFAINWNQPFAENPNNIPAVADMISRFHDNNIKVELLSGDAAWIYRPDSETGGTTGLPPGGLAYDFGRQMVERFIDYQNAEWNTAQPGPCNSCFDGIRLDVEPHGLRPVVLNQDFAGWPTPDPTDPRVIPGGNPTAEAISGFSGEPLFWIIWNPTFDNGFDFDTGLALPPGAFTESSVADRNEILLRFWDMLKRFKGQLQDDRGVGHITNDPAAVAQYLVMATDQVPWYWTVGVQDEAGTHIVPESHAMVDHDNNAGTADIEVFKAALSVPDRVALMGYRDQYEHVDSGTGLVLWFRSVKQWDEGHNLDDAAIGGPRGALPYLESIGKPTSAGLEFITQQQLGFNSKFVTFGEDHTDPTNHPRDPYSQLKDTISQIGSDMLALYPNSLEGIRYHEYFQPLPGKSADAGEFFPTFSSWANLEIFPSNLGDWQTFHNVTPTTATLPALDTVPTVPDGDALTLTITNFQPGPSLTGVVQAKVNGLPAGTVARNFHVIVTVKVLGDTNYFQGGKGFETIVGGLDPLDNGQLDAAGNFEIRPIRIGDPTVSKVVWWFDLHDSNGHFIRRFTLDPIDHCFNDGDPTNGCVPLNEVITDRFYDPQDPLNIDVRDLIQPALVDLTFANLTVSGDIQKSTGADIGVISGDITNFAAEGLNPTDFHVRTWVEFTHDGFPAAGNGDPNWESEVNVWNLMSSDVPIDASGHFVATNLRPVNPTGDSDSFGGNNGTYKIWVSVHDNTDGITRIGCPDDIDGIKPSAARFLDLDFSLVDVQEVPNSPTHTGTAGVDVAVHTLGIDSTVGVVSGNATGLDPSKTYHAYVWAEWYDIDKNIWQERAEPDAIETIDIGKGGYFQVDISANPIVPAGAANKGATVFSPRNIWVSIHDRPLDLNEFPIIPNSVGTIWPQCGGANPHVDQTGAFPLWLGRFFHMDSSFDYYEGFRPATDIVAPSTGTPTAPNTLAASAIDSSNIQLTWNDASTNEVGFSIEQSVGGGAFVEILKVHGGSATGSKTWTVGGLSGSTTYSFRIRAFNKIGTNSGYSNTAVETTLPDGPPTLPTLDGFGIGTGVQGRILNMPQPSTDWHVRTWIKTDLYYAQGVDISVDPDGTFSAHPGLFGTTSVIWVTLHPAATDPWGTGTTTANSSSLSQSFLGAGAIVFGPMN